MRSRSNTNASARKLDCSWRLPSVAQAATAVKPGRVAGTQTNRKAEKSNSEARNRLRPRAVPARHAVGMLTECSRRLVGLTRDIQ